MRRERTSIAPAVLFSALVHAALLFAAWFYWPKTDPGGGTFGITPVTLVAQGPMGNTPAPVPDTPEEIATPEPVPDEAPAVVAPPTPAPVPTPAPAKSQTKPVAKPTAPGVGSSRASDDDFLTSLSTSIGGGGSKRSGGPQGRPVVKQGPTTAMTGGCLSASNPCPWKEGLGEKVERYWNPNCAVEGGSRVQLLAKLTFNAGGYIDGALEISDARTGRVILVADKRDTSQRVRQVDQTNVVNAAAVRAYSAITRVEPYSGVPPELVGRRIVLRLNSDKAC